MRFFAFILAAFAACGGGGRHGASSVPDVTDEHAPGLHLAPLDTQLRPTRPVAQEAALTRRVPRPRPTPPPPAPPAAPAPKKAAPAQAAVPRVVRAAPVSGTNEPSGMNTLLDWSGATLAPWLHTTLGGRLGGKVEFTPDSGSKWTYGPWDLDSVRECRVKDCNLMDSRQTQPSNPSGNPAHLYYIVPDNLRPVHSLYARMDLIVEPGWLQNASNTNKILEVFVANGVGPILMLYGGQNLHAAIANDYWKDTLYAGCVIGQKSPHCPGGGSIGPDVFTTGVKHRVEMLVVTNTQGRDGRAALWLDGRRQIDVGNVRWSAGAGTIGQVDLNAIWGGRGGRLTRPQHIWLSGLHISVSSDYLTAASAANAPSP